jgi:glycosyltransferase involved in cell wall biosynthesis
MANDALLEALAIGCPIIVTDLPATRDYVPDSAGIFVPRHEAEAGAEAILRLLDHSDAATAMGRRAREHAVTSLDWRVIAQCYRDLWNELGS